MVKIIKVVMYPGGQDFHGNYHDGDIDHDVFIPEIDEDLAEKLLEVLHEHCDKYTMYTTEEIPSEPLPF